MSVVFNDCLNLLPLCLELAVDVELQSTRLDTLLSRYSDDVSAVSLHDYRGWHLGDLVFASTTALRVERQKSVERGKNGRTCWNEVCLTRHLL